MKVMRKSILVKIPKDLLEEACQLSNANQTQTLVMGLRSLIMDIKRGRLVAAGGKFHFSLNLNKGRQRIRL